MDGGSARNANFAAFDDVDRFVITDANLPLGGLNDIDAPSVCGGPQSCWRYPHRFHRQGKSFDVRSKGLSIDNARAFTRDCNATGP